MLVTLCGFFPKHLASAHFLNWLSCIVKGKKLFDLLGTSLESKQDEEISSSIKALS